MSSSRIEPDHLEPLYEAKQRFNKALTPRMEAYEKRLTKNFLQRGAEYFTTGFGFKGYERTKKFLTEMNEENISCTEKLIDLTQRYTEGYNLPLLLKIAVLETCKVDSCHVALVKEEVIDRIYRKYPPHKVALYLPTAQNKAIEIIYNSIIKSEDYGNHFIRQLNNTLNHLSHRLT